MPRFGEQQGAAENFCQGQQERWQARSDSGAGGGILTTDFTDDTDFRGRQMAMNPCHARNPWSKAIPSALGSHHHSTRTPLCGGFGLTEDGVAGYACGRANQTSRVSNFSPGTGKTGEDSIEMRRGTNPRRPAKRLIVVDRGSNFCSRGRWRSFYQRDLFQGEECSTDGRGWQAAFGRRDGGFR